MRRYSIEEAVAEVIDSDEDVSLAAEVRQLGALKQIATGLDQLVNREKETKERHGKHDGMNSRANVDDVESAVKRLRVLELGALAGKAMIQGILNQMDLGENGSGPGFDPETDDPRLTKRGRKVKQAVQTEPDPETPPQP